MTDLSPILVPGDTCWRVERADRVALIIDGADYFCALRSAVKQAQQSIIFIGWDFDFGIELLPGESDEDGLAPDGLPNAIGPFLEAIVALNDKLQIDMLRWSGALLVGPGRALPALHISLMAPDSIRLSLDGKHPVGACHHQKIVVIDDQLAFVGGLDLTQGRWDTHRHIDPDPRRVSGVGRPLKPWHDATSALTGPAAQALADLARARWARVNHEDIPPAVIDENQNTPPIWPEDLEVNFTDIDVAIARSAPPEKDTPIINEIEELYLASIKATEKWLYIESQYFASDSIFHAIRARLIEDHGPEIVIVNPAAAQNHLEDAAMHATRARMVKDLKEVDHENRFRMYYPQSEAGTAIYVHAKICIIDDNMVRIGSSNIDRRSMGFDTECDIAIAPSTTQDRRSVAAYRARLLAEHMNLEPGDVGRSIAETDSLIATIEALNPDQGRCLREMPEREEDLLDRFMMKTRFFDPQYGRFSKGRIGVTTRHLMIGAAVIGAGIYLTKRRRRK